MYEVLEEWVPVAEFKTDFPDLKSDHFISINNLIIIYRVVSNDGISFIPQTISDNIYFSLEDAWDAIDNM